MSVNEQPGYYAIITADVRYSKEINANEKLLFAEITALSNSTGICWASNNYFSKLFNVTPQAISKWVKNLEKNNFISCTYIYKNGTKEIAKRDIRCINGSLYGINDSCKGYQHTIKDNTTRVNNTSITDDSLFLSISKKFNFVEEEVFNKLVKHLSTKFKDVTKVRLTNNIKKFENCTNLFNLAVEKMIELDYSGLFIPSAKDIKDNKIVDRKPNHNVNGAEEYQF